MSSNISCWLRKIRKTQDKQKLLRLFCSIKILLIFTIRVARNETSVKYYII